MGVKLDLSNKVYGSLTVISRANNHRGRTAWNCKCNCGTTAIVTTQLLQSGHTTSCGCAFKKQLVKRNKTHGLICGGKTRLYKLYIRMRERCNSPSCKSFKHYGGRGIKIGQDFEAFNDFYTWALHNGYKDSLTIERIDINKGYTANNCTWIPIEEQARNKQNSVWTVDMVSVARTLKLYTRLTNKEIAAQLGVAPHNIKALTRSWLDVGALPI